MARSKTYKRYVTKNFQTLPRRTRHRLIKTISKPCIAPENQQDYFMPATDETAPSLAFPVPNEFKSIEQEDSSATCHPQMYNNAKISEIESTILIFGFTTRHRFTKEATEDLLNLINHHLPIGVSVPTSTYLLRKKFSQDDNCRTYTTHYVCSECSSYVGKDEKGVCNDCSQPVKPENVFLTFKLGAILSDTLKDGRLSNNLYLNLLKRNEKLQNDESSDIVSGSMYKSLGHGKFDSTCLLNTDGIPAFKSSNKSLWPVLVSINELDYKIRRNNTLLFGLWIGSTKPDFDIFLEPIVEECNYLSTNTVKWTANGNSIKSFVHFPLFTADSVARCQVQGINQFNGAFGCPWCYSKGKTLWIDERKHKWVYPYEKASLNLRTNQSFLLDARKLKVELDKTRNSKCNHVNGVNAGSQLLLLNTFDIVNGFVFDVMHTAFLGVTRTFTNMWLDSTNSNQPFYLGTKKTEIDKRLLNFSVPFESSRTIRPISDCSHWKASEWRIWTYILPLVLKGILADAYLNHFQKYATSIMILNDDLIRDSDREFAKSQLQQFVQHVDNFYGTKACTFNVHALLHAADCVNNWGPLWAYSAFQFEHFNGILLNNFKGSQHVVKQIAARSIETVQLLKLGRESIFNEQARQFYQTMIDGGKFYAKYQRAIENVMFVGPSKDYKLTDKEVKKLEELGIFCVHARSFRRCIILGKVYTTNLTDSKKRCNSVVCTKSNDLVMIKRLIYVAEQNIGIAIGNSIRYELDSSNPYLICVKGIGKTVKVIKLADISKQKYIVRKSVSIASLLRLPNVSEAE